MTLGDSIDVLKLVPADGSESNRVLDRKARAKPPLPEMATTLVAPADRVQLFVERIRRLQQE